MAEERVPRKTRRIWPGTWLARVLPARLFYYLLSSPHSGLLEGSHTLYGAIANDFRKHPAPSHHLNLSQKSVAWIQVIPRRIKITRLTKKRKTYMQRRHTILASKRINPVHNNGCRVEPKKFDVVYILCVTRQLTFLYTAKSTRQMDKLPKIGIRFLLSPTHWRG